MAAPNTLPVTSGFHMKGNAYRGLIEYAEREVAGGIAAVTARLSPASRSFFAQSFTAGGWYDVLPVDELTRVSATLAKVSHDEYCRRAGASILERDKNGVYRAILRFATPDLLVRALPYTTKRYFDFVSLDVLNVDPGSYRVTVSGVPRAVVQTYIAITTVFILGAIEGAGASDVVTRTTPPRTHGTVRGLPTVQFERFFSWKV